MEVPAQESELPLMKKSELMALGMTDFLIESNLNFGQWNEIYEE